MTDAVLCPNCGTRNAVGENFCNTCGTYLGWPSTPRDFFNDFWFDFTPRADGQYDVEARAPDGSTAHLVFWLPLSDLEIENTVLRFSSPRRARDTRQSAAKWRLAETFGEKLATTLFADPIGALFAGSRHDAMASRRRLRVFLSLRQTPGLWHVPWELLHLESEFLGLGRTTPIIRFISSDLPITPARIDRSLRILGVVASPEGLPTLDVDFERALVQGALKTAIQIGTATIDWLDPPTLPALDRALRTADYHILQVIGTGATDNGTDSSGLLYLENSDRSPAAVAGSTLARLLRDHGSIRLAVLHSSDASGTTDVDPFTTVATSVVQLGVPAVLATQFEMSTHAGIVFTRDFYQALLTGQSVDVAVGEGRKAVVVDGNTTDWAAPVLFLSNPNARLFEFARAKASISDVGRDITAASVNTNYGQIVIPEAPVAAPKVDASYERAPPLPPRPAAPPSRGNPGGGGGIGVGGIIGGVVGGIAGGVAGGVRGVGNAALSVGERLRRAGPGSEGVVSKPVVNTGLSTMAHPDEPLDPDVAPLSGGEYLFWLEIAPPIKGSIEERPTGAPAQLVAAEAVLDVVLFDVSGAAIVKADANEGRLKLLADGSAIVVRQPGADPAAALSTRAAARRLLFPLNRVEVWGAVRFRCNLYHAGVLIQSRLVRCAFRETAMAMPGALRSDLDYVLARTLAPERLTETQPHELSVLVNANDDGTHGFYFASGKDRWRRSATFDADALQAYLDQARGALRLAAWGSQEAWHDQPYLYDGEPDHERLLKDLIPICTRGYAFYSELIDRLAGRDDLGESRAEELTALMRPPGSVQIALLGSPRSVLPASLIYDHDLDTGASLASYTFCEQFLSDLAKPDGLRNSICLAGNCPNREGHVTVICPSGLWGYRHSIGLPVSLEARDEWARTETDADDEPDSGGDPPVFIDLDGVPQFVAGVSTDPAFTEWAEHEKALRALRPELGWHFANTRMATLDMLQSANPHIVYFYCHGGMANGKPFIQVGPLNDESISSDVLRARHVHWRTPRPLVFINGCRTTAVEPREAHELVSGFVTIARASGVIGTEITIFEPLARAFAESFLRAFVGGSTVGEAVRMARVDLLQHANPLGLAYTAYALSSLKLGRSQVP